MAKTKSRPVLQGSTELVSKTTKTLPSKDEEVALGQTSRRKGGNEDGQESDKPVPKTLEQAEKELDDAKGEQNRANSLSNEASSACVAAEQAYRDAKAAYSSAPSESLKRDLEHASEQYEAAKTASARAAGYLREVNIKVGRLKGALTRRRKTERRKRPKGVNTAQGRDDISSELTDEDDPAFEKVLEQIAQSELTAPSLNRPRRLVLSGVTLSTSDPGPAPPDDSRHVLSEDRLGNTKLGTTGEAERLQSSQDAGSLNPDVTAKPSPGPAQDVPMQPVTATERSPSPRHDVPMPPVAAAEKLPETIQAVPTQPVSTNAMEEVPDSQAPGPSPDIPIQPATTAENLPSQVVLTQLISVPSSGEAPDPSVIMDMAAKPPESDKGKKRAYEDQFADSSSVGPHARKRAKEGTSVLGDISAGEDSDYEQWPKRGKGSKPRQRIVNSDEESASDDPDKTNRVNSEGPQDATGKQQVDQVQTTTGKVTRSDKNGKPRKAEKRHQPAQKQKKHDIEGVGMNEESQLVNAPKPQKARKKKAKVPKQQVGMQTGDESDGLIIDNEPLTEAENEEHEDEPNPRLTSKRKAKKAPKPNAGKQDSDGLVVDNGQLTEEQIKNREEQLAKIHKWLEDSVNGDGPSAIGHPPVGLRAFVYAAPENLEEAVTASREIAMTSMVSRQGFLICRYHTKSQKTRNKVFELVDGYDGVNYGRPWQPIGRRERASLLAREQLNPTTSKETVDVNDPLLRYRWQVPGWIRVKSRDPRAMDCGCFVDYVLLEAFLWKTGTLGSLTSNFVDDWGREFLTPRHRALVCESFRQWTRLELDDMYSLVSVNGKWVRRDNMHARRVQLMKLQGMIGSPMPTFKIVKGADEDNEMAMLEEDGNADVLRSDGVDIAVARV